MPKPRHQGRTSLPILPQTPPKTLAPNSPSNRYEILSPPEMTYCRVRSKMSFSGPPFSSLPPIDASCSLSASPDHEDFHPCQMGTLLTLGQIGTLGSALLKTGAAIVHCHVCRFPAPSGPLAGVPPLLLTVAALRFPSTSCPPIAPLPRIALAPPATGGASGDSSKSARLLCLRQHFPAKTPSGQPISGPKRGRKPGPFLETSSLFPPPAALRLFPHNTVENFVHNVENFPLCHPVEKL